MMSGGMMYSKGDIVLIQFPFSDLVNAKKRPMVILAVREQDIIGCAITSNPNSEGIPLNEFAGGALPFDSKIKYWQINTFLEELVLQKIATITKRTHKELIEKINKLVEI